MNYERHGVPGRIDDLLETKDIVAEGKLFMHWSTIQGHVEKMVGHGYSEANTCPDDHP